MARSLEHCDHPLCLSVSYFGTMPEVHEADQAQAAEGVAPDDVVGQVLQSESFPADVSLGPKPPPISPGGLAFEREARRSRPSDVGAEAARIPASGLGCCQACSRCAPVAPGTTAGPLSSFFELQGAAGLATAAVAATSGQGL